MATSGNFNFAASTYGPGVGYPNYAKITWSATWNQSALQWTVNWSATAQGASTAGRWTTVYGSNNNCNSYITVKDENGNVLQTKSITAKMETIKNGTVLLEGSFNVGVTSTGTRSLVFSGQIYFETTGSAGISSGNQTFALDTVAMASSITSVTSNVSVGSSGGSVTVNINRKSSSYTHTVVWKFGSQSATQTGQTTSATYTIPASWLDQIPNAASGAATVTVTTFNGSTQIGEPVSASFTITANVNPTIGSVSVAPRGAAYSAGITSVYIAGYSTALITASSVAGVQGSTIKKVEFIKDGGVLSSNTTPTYTYTTGTLTGTSATFKVRVTDSRGKTAEKSASAITIQAYANPTISASVFRSNSSGTSSNDGTYIRITATATATPSANSITALKYATKASTASSYGAEADIGSGVTKSGFANTTSYDVRIRATDKIGNSVYQYFTVPTSSYTMDFKEGGKGVAFGKVAETDNLVDSEWDIKAPRFRGGVYFPRVSQDANTLPPINTVVFEEYASGTAYNLPTNAFYHIITWHSFDTRYATQLALGMSTNHAYYRALINNSWQPWKELVNDNIPDASALQRGLVNTDAQTFAGVKTFLKTVRVNDTMANGSGLSLQFSDKNNDAYAAMWVAFSNYGGRLYFREMSGNASGLTSYGEVYRLPNPDAGIASSVNYDILTSKSAVTVGQGGTGATTAAAARSNLGLGAGANLLSGTLANTETTLKDAHQYSALVIYGKPTGGSLVSMTIPMSAIGTSFEQWQLADNSGYRTFQVKYSGNDVIIKGVAATSNASITGVRGII